MEVVWPRQKTAGFGVGPRKRCDQYICLSAYQRHLNFGFYYAAELPDPDGLLNGTGKRMRSVRIKAVEVGNLCQVQHARPGAAVGGSASWREVSECRRHCGHRWLSRLSW